MLSPNQQALLSEEDIRTRVVATWLVNHGFTAENISVEFSFELRLGRNVYRVGKELPHSPTFRPRADVLVRSSDGRNLLIIEVKAPNETLDENAKAQGISYARLLKSGGIAPFVVITNGHETQIYDSITEEAMQDAYIPINHRHAQNRFRVSIDDIALRAEALETFVSLSSDNLLAFGRAQVVQRIRLLRSDDPFSGKKYIPALYVEREDARKQLHRLLDEERRQVVLLAGAPQVGKTNFVCHSVEERLENGQPCLFYPAIDMEGGLIEEISKDFNWILNNDNNPYQLVTKIVRILQRANQQLLIFIDGWNEASQGIARAIDKGSARLSCAEVQLVISFTQVAARQLLLDQAGNLSHIADLASINEDSIPTIEISPDQVSRRSSLVEIRKYNKEEVEKAYKIYANCYRTRVSSLHRKVDDPFLLRIGMQSFTEKYLPDTFDEPSLLERSLYQKASRGLELSESTLTSLLYELGDEMLISDASVSEIIARKRWQISSNFELPKGLFEAAILTKVFSDQNIPSLDFYCSRERDFVVAYWVGDWLKSLLSNFEKTALSESIELLKTELLRITNTKVGNEALSWFFRQPQHLNHLKLASLILSTGVKPDLKRLILSSIYKNPGCAKADENEWRIEAAEVGAEDNDAKVRAEVAKLLAAFSNDNDNLIRLFDNEDKMNSIVNDLLEAVEDDALIERGTLSIIIKALASVNYDGGVNIYKYLKHSSPYVQAAAAGIIAYREPKDFLKIFSRKAELGELEAEYIRAIKLIGVIDLALEQLGDIYYGYSEMCDFPMYFELLQESPEEHIVDYQEMSRICLPVIRFYQQDECGKKLLKFLNSIAPNSSSYKDSSVEILSQERRLAEDNMSQLSLDLDVLEDDLDS
jgi:hypothetical protein